MRTDRSFFNNSSVLSPAKQQQQNKGQGDEDGREELQSQRKAQKRHRDFREIKKGAE
jgi:hypothetical protein